MAEGCKQNTDPQKLARIGTRQDERLASALNPAKADWPQVDERRPEHALVFAKAYAAFLKFIGPDGAESGTWQAFFSQDAAVQLAVAAVEPIDDYRSFIKATFDFLKINKQSITEDERKQHEAQLKKQLGTLFGTAGSLAWQLEQFKHNLPDNLPLKSVLHNLIQRQLAPALARLISYYQADFSLAEAARLIGDTTPGIKLLGASADTFGKTISQPFSNDWFSVSATDWSDYKQKLGTNASVFGSGATVFDRINHIAMHNLFTSAFDAFLKALARTVNEARTALAETFTQNGHEPHYALFLAFVRLLGHVKRETDTLTQRHLDFYYRDILRLKEKPAEPGHVHLLAELAKQAESHELKAGALLKAGKDATGVEAFFANDRTFVANKAKVTVLKSVYLLKNPKNQPNESLPLADGRLYAAPVADSDDGLGAKLTSVDQSWQPFFNKLYEAGELADIRMPKADVGFAVASHYLLLAEGQRTVTLVFKMANVPVFSAGVEDFVCWLTGAEGWLQVPLTAFIDFGVYLIVHVELDGAIPPIVPYSAKIHGYGFATDLPVMRVMLTHRADANYPYQSLQGIRIEEVLVFVTVSGLKTLALSNDFGPVDVSKPFQPFGALPAANSSLVIGSKEAFQKHLLACTIKVTWQSEPAPFAGSTVNLVTEFLHKGFWQSSDLPATSITSTVYNVSAGLSDSFPPFVDAPDLSLQSPYASNDRHGFVRLKTLSDFGQSAYATALDTYVSNLVNGTTPNPKPQPPIGPSIIQLTVNYTAQQILALNSDSADVFTSHQASFYHITPFGHAEQHGFLKTGAPDANIYLLPQFQHVNDGSKTGFDARWPEGHAITHEAECYIGLADLNPPQNLALLFQVVDGTAAPLSKKPKPHLHWSYLSGNEWQAFDTYTIEDGTSEWLNSGVVTLAIPKDATADNTLLPQGHHWLRVGVASESDAVCKLQWVAAQGFSATFQNQGNDPNFSATPLAAGTIGKLSQPDAAVKTISQPFASFGGRGAEQAGAFYTRISERLRHKDRAVALWDYERLILQAFPAIFQAKCLNHAHYEPDSYGGFGVYRELAPGHVTVVTVPDQSLHNLRDPLRPYTSLGLLKHIDAFLKQRLPCSVTLHVANPLFEEVTLSFNVRFHDGFDQTFYRNALNTAVMQFLSPWAFLGGGNASFGGKIYRSVLLNFVEEQPYVDYVTDFKLAHRYLTFADNGSVSETVIADASEVQGSKAVSLLVSAREHGITVLNGLSDTPDTTCPCTTV